MRCKIEHTMCKQCHEKNEISFSKLVYFWSEKCFEDERLHGCVATWICHISTFQHTLTHTFDTSNSLYESQKAHVYVINIWWVIRWGLLQQRQHIESTALVRLSTRCIFSNRQHSFIPRMLAYIQQFFVCLFYVIALKAMLSFLHIQNSKYNLNITWRQGKILWHFFWFTSLQYSSKNSCHYFHFQWFFFLQRIQNCLCNVFF